MFINLTFSIEAELLLLLGEPDAEAVWLLSLLSVTWQFPLTSASLITFEVTGDLCDLCDLTSSIDDLSKTVGREALIIIPAFL